MTHLDLPLYNPADLPTPTPIHNPSVCAHP
jgi:hypothetical protein